MPVSCPSSVRLTMMTVVQSSGFWRFCSMSDSTDRLSVLFISSWYPSEDNPIGGVFIREHAKAASIYDDVVVMNVRPSTKTSRRLFTITDQTEEGVRTIRAHYRCALIPRKMMYVLWFYLHWHVFCGLIKGGFQPDVIHAHVYEAGVPSVLLGRLYGIPVVTTEHSSTFPRRLLKGHRLTMARFGMRWSQVVLPVSRYLRHHIEAHGIQARFQVVPNVVDTSLFHPPVEDKVCTTDNNKKQLLTVALLTPVKGIPYLIEAIHRLKKTRQDFELNIVGDGHQRAEYETLAGKLNLGNVVRFHGLKTRHEVAEFMRCCDIFVLPSLFETFGVVAIEALASGKPVVATDIGGLREIIVDEVGRLVPPKDAAALATILDEMLDRYQVYPPQAIVDYARQRYSAEVVGRKLHHVYLEVR